MNIELVGTLKVIFAKEKISDKMDKQNLVVTIDENTPYHQDILVQVINKNIEKVSQSGVKMGDKVRVKCNLRGKESKTETGSKYFNQVDLWEISKG